MAARAAVVGAATALWVSVFNLAIRLDALVGGLVVDRTARRWVSLRLAAALFLLAVAVRAGGRRPG